MAYDATGKIYISYSDMEEFLKKYVPSHGGEIFSFDILHLHDIGEEIEINYAVSTENPPAEWSDAPEWLRKKGNGS